MFAECADCRWWPCSLRTKRCLTNPPTYGPSCRYMLQQLTNTKTDRYRHQQEMDHRSRLVKMSPNSITCLFSAAIDVITCEQLVQNSSVNSSQNALSPKIELVFICHKTHIIMKYTCKNYKIGLQNWPTSWLTSDLLSPKTIVHPWTEAYLCVNFCEVWSRIVICRAEIYTNKQTSATDQSASRNFG